MNRLDKFRIFTYNLINKIFRKKLGRNQLINLKNGTDLKNMRRAGQIVAECHKLIRKHIKPGVTPLELDAMVEKYIRSCDAIPAFKGHHGFPNSICYAPNDVICHGIPDNKPLKDGDVVTFDIGAKYKGFFGDSAWTYAVGNVTDEIKTLMERTEKSLYLGIEQARAGNYLNDIGATIDKYINQFGYGNVVEFSGHGIGKNLWEEPAVMHVKQPNRGPKLKAGMGLAIEPMITLGNWKAKIDRDGWTARTVDGSICVQYEHTIIITEDGPEIMTKQ